MSDDVPTDEPIRTLTRPQRRVLGVLLEKAFTTPDQYPLTPKAVTTGCNQKSNRSPVTSYSEDAVLDTLDELRALGLVLEVHTESGRTSRFRHQMRKKYTFTEPQLAILTELFLRGRQTLGELRSRAGRMVPIDGLDSLRNELTALMAEDYVKSNGDLARRGVEVDHGFHGANEPPSFATSTSEAVEAPSSASTAETVATAPAAAAPPDLVEMVEALKAENGELRNEVDRLREEFSKLESRFDDLRRDLGG